MRGGRKVTEKTDLLCLSIIYPDTCLRLHPCLPDGLFPLIVCICQSYPSLRNLLARL